MNRRLLFVDDDPRVLTACERTLRGRYDLDTSPHPMKAIEKIAEMEAPYAVIVSDMQMPGMNGLELLRRVADLSPQSIRLILTGNADLQTAIDAVNEGHIFRFLEKPCPPDTLTRVLDAALEQYQLERSERDLLDNTLRGSIKVLTDVLALVNPEAFSVASRVTMYARHLCAHFQLPEPWRFEVAAMLSQLGCVVLPTDTLEAVRLGRKLSANQEALFARHPRIAGDLLGRIPRLEAIAAMVERQRESAAQPSVPPLEQDEITLGAQILKISVDFDVLVRSRNGHIAAIRELKGREDEYDAALVDAMAALPEDTLPCESRVVGVQDLMCGMILDEDLRTTIGTLLVARGIEVTQTLLTRIHNYRDGQAVSGDIRVLVPSSVDKWRTKVSAPMEV